MNSNPGTPMKGRVGRPPLKGVSPSNTSNTASSGTNSISNNDFASQLPTHVRKPMQELVQELKAARLSSQEFYSRARELLGEPLYSRLLQSMKQNAMGRMMNQQPPPQNPTTTSSTAVIFGNATSTSTATAALDRNIDSAALQDVMQYAGVDLKAEAEMILREQQQGVFSAASYAGLSTLEDVRMDTGYFFNTARLKAIMMQAGRPYGLEVQPEAVDALAKVVLRRLAGLMCKLVKYSRHRSNLARRHYKIKVENDPRKQIWLLEQMLCSNPSIQQPSPTNNATSSNNNNNNNNNADSDGEEVKKKARKMGPDETAIKAKLTNATASAATGLKLKSWMTSSSTTTLDDPSTPSTGSTHNKEDKNNPATTMGVGSEEKRLNLSQAPSASPLTERDLIERYLGRTVNVKDLIRVLEEECENGRRSMILHHLYHFQ